MKENVRPQSYLLSLHIIYHLIIINITTVKLLCSEEFDLVLFKLK